jgi:hypothetical protein
MNGQPFQEIQGTPLGSGGKYRLGKKELERKNGKKLPQISGREGWQMLPLRRIPRI